MLFVKLDFILVEILIRSDWLRFTETELDYFLVGGNLLLILCQKWAPVGNHAWSVEDNTLLSELNKFEFYLLVQGEIIMENGMQWRRE